MFADFFRQEPDGLAVFIHTPKTAGTSFTRFLVDSYGDQVADVEAPDAEWWTAHSRTRMSIRVVCAHFRWSKIRSAERPLFAFGFVREPVERFLSLHQFVSEQPGHALHAAAVERHPLAFLEHVQANAPQLLNAQCRFLADVAEADAGLEIIGSRPGFVLRLEQISEAAERIRAEAPFAAPLQRLNVSARKPATRETEEAIRSAFAEDVRLYAALA